MNSKKYDVVILGKGFKAMIIAYAATKLKKKILVISDSSNFFGTMGELNWNEENFDLGYQFFDGLDTSTKKILHDFVGEENLTDLGYGAGSYTNGNLEKYHALPYWPHMGKLFIFSATLNLIINFIKYHLFKNKSKIVSLEDLYDQLPLNINNILKKASVRNFNLEPKKLSWLACDFTPFAEFRQTLFSEKVSLFLKNNFEYFSKTLATKRRALKLDCISLYPYKKNMNFIAKLMYEKLNKYGVEFYQNINYNVKNNKNNNISVIVDDTEIQCENIYFCENLDKLISLLNFNQSLNQSIHYVSQVIFLFSQNKIYSDLQYVHGNDLNINVNRVSNISLYSKTLKNNDSVLIAEVPCNKNSKIWNEPEIYTDQIWKELQMMKVASPEEKYKDYKIIKLKKTFPIPLVNYTANLETIKKYLSDNFNNKFRIPGIEVIGRHDYIKSICKDDYLNLS